jgi:hypothetical protein
MPVEFVLRFVQVEFPISIQKRIMRLYATSVVEIPNVSKHALKEDGTAFI